MRHLVFCSLQLPLVKLSAATFIVNCTGKVFLGTPILAFKSWQTQGPVSIYRQVHNAIMLKWGRGKAENI